MIVGRAALVVSCLAVVTVTEARAGEATDPSETIDDAERPPPKEKPEEPFRTKSGYAQFFATTFIGTGLRFNNPYRLATPLGDDAESVSRTATYIDIGFGATVGNPLGFQHGVTLRTTAAVQGVGQVIMTPSYLLWRRWTAFALYGRAGLPLVLSPDVTGGLEAGVGATWFFLGGFGVVGEIVGDLFYGAGTRESAVTTYPILSGQLGLIAAYEVLP